MPVIKGELVAPDKLIVQTVGYIVNQPPDETWIVVPSVPYPQDYPQPTEPGKSAQLIYNPQNGEFSFEFIDVPLTPEQEKERLEQLLDDATSLLIENGVL